MFPRFLAAASSCLLAGALTAGCNSGPDVDKVPVGTKVDVTEKDGSLVTGKLADKNASSVSIDEGRKTVQLDRKDIDDIRVADDSKPEPPPKAKFRLVSVPDGTPLSIRLETALASNANHVEDTVSGSLVAPVSVDGIDVFPAGSTVKGTVTAAQASGKVKGLASLGVKFTSIDVNGVPYPIAAPYSQQAKPTKGQDAKKVGIGAGAGAVIGALVGGGKGAAIGAGVGGGAGTAVVMSTSGDEVQWPTGTVLAVPLTEAVDVKVPIKHQEK